MRLKGVQFGGLVPIPTNPELDPPPYACLNCWKFEHGKRECTKATLVPYCYNCGRRGVVLTTCLCCGPVHRVRDRARQPVRTQEPPSGSIAPQETPLPVSPPMERPKGEPVATIPSTPPAAQQNALFVVTLDGVPASTPDREDGENKEDGPRKRRGRRRGRWRGHGGVPAVGATPERVEITKALALQRLVSSLAECGTDLSARIVRAATDLHSINAIQSLIDSVGDLGPSERDAVLTSVLQE